MSSSAEPRRRDGSTDPIDALYRECLPRLRHMLRGRLGTADEAEEVAQDAFANLLARGDDGVDLVDRYLFRTAANLATDRLRRKRRWRDRDRVDPDTLDLACAQPGPDRAVSAREEVARIRTMLDQLPISCRHAFVRRRFDAYSYAAIADEMGISESMVRKHVLRATRYCRPEHGDLFV